MQMYVNIVHILVINVMIHNVSPAYQAISWIQLPNVNNAIIHVSTAMTLIIVYPVQLVTIYQEQINVKNVNNCKVFVQNVRQQYVWTVL